MDSLSLTASDAEEFSGSISDPALLPTSSSRSARPRTDAELVRVLTKAVSELGLEWSPPEEPSHSRLDEWFLPGCQQAPRQCSPPFFPEVHDELTKSWRGPYSSHIRSSASSALTSVDGAEEKGYEHLPPLDESVAAHLCPPTAIGWKTRANHPSKPCRATSALAGLPGQAAHQRGGRSRCSFTQGPEECDGPGPARHQSHRPGHRAVNVPGGIGTPSVAHFDR